MPIHRPRSLYELSLIAVVCTLSGCTSTKQSNTPRTATEQLLISNAIDQSLNRVDFTPLAGSSVFVEEKYLECVDKNYIVGSIRHKLLQANASIAASPAQADAGMEVRSGGVGTDVASSYLGVPGFTVPGMVSLPDIKLVNRDSQKAVAKIGLVMYDVKRSREIGEGGVSTAIADENKTYIMGFGPRRSGTLLQEVDRSVVYPGERLQEFPNQVTFSRPPPVAEQPEATAVQVTGDESAVDPESDRY
jgi:hypothetical protein